MNPLVETAIAADIAVEQCDQRRTVLLARRRLAFIEAHEAGVSNRELAHHTGLSSQRVAKVIDGNGPPKFRKGTRRSVWAAVEL